MNFKRHHISIIKKRLLDEPRRFIQVLYGPRQTGKTTLVQQFLDDIDLPFHYASTDAIPITDHAWIAQQWETARLKMKQHGNSEAVLVIDEIQKIENWSEQVKKEWDSDSRNKFRLKVMILGSSRLLIQKGLTESLAGRYESVYVGHWSFTEMHEAFGFDVENFVWFGGYPGSAPLIHDEKRWKQYVLDSLIETSVSKDILMMTRIDKPALLRQLFGLGCQYSGQILSFNKMLGQMTDAGNTTTLSHYLHLLDTAGLLAGLEKFTPNKIRQRASSPKFQVHNMAFITAQDTDNFEKVRMNPSAWGRRVESAVGSHLLNHGKDGNYDLFYWREGNLEVDFVIQRGEDTIGIEVKSGTTSRKSGMHIFSKEFNPTKVLMVGNEGIPWQDFLQIPPSELF